jgi:hypothetical protein
MQYHASLKHYPDSTYRKVLKQAAKKGVLRTSNAPVKLHFSWFVLRRGMTTDRTGIVGLYLAISLQIEQTAYEINFH